MILSYLDSYFGGYLGIQIQLYNYEITPAHLVSIFLGRKHNQICHLICSVCQKFTVSGKMPSNFFQYEFHLVYLKTTLKIRKDCWLISFVIFIVLFVNLQLSKYREVITIILNNFFSERFARVSVFTDTERTRIL